ncbi:MAG: hypothetical protein HY685_00770 [Chloroflexi bacterium]|nr:hypothetical protein [Chloroflexota bacterium]
MGVFRFYLEGTVSLDIEAESYEEARARSQAQLEAFEEAVKELLKSKDPEVSGVVSVSVR